MPELAEVRIMSDYINHHSKKRKFTKLYHVEKGTINGGMSLYRYNVNSPAISRDF